MKGVLGGVAVLAAVVGCEPSTDPQAERLELVEEGATAINPDRAITGATVTTESTLVLRSNRDAYRLVDPGSLKEVCSNHVLTEVWGIGGSAEGIRMLGTDGTSVIEIVNCRAIRLADLADGLYPEAVFDGRAWHLAASEEAAGTEMPSVNVFPHPWHADADSLPPIISWTGSRILVAQRGRPYQWQALSEDPQEPRPGWSPDLESEFLASGEWYVTGLLDLGRDAGVLQMLADLRSQRRLLVRYGPDGQQLTKTRIDVPLGLLAADTPRRVLYLLRRTDRVEVVAYSWE